MKKQKNKSYLLISLILINVITLTSCTNNENTKDKYDIVIKNIEINEDNGRALNLSSTEILNISKNKNNKLEVSVDIKNRSKFDISNINFKYEEFDKNKNKIANSKTFSDISLNPDDKAKISFGHKEYTETIKITGYSYEVFDKIVFVDLVNDKVKIKENKYIVENSSDYEVLVVPSEKEILASKKGNTYSINIVNSSDKDLGNVIVKVAQINQDNEYTKVHNISANSVLKPLDDANIEVTMLEDVKNIQVIGYSYDDLRLKSNITINLKSHQVKMEK